MFLCISGNTAGFEKAWVRRYFSRSSRQGAIPGQAVAFGSFAAESGVPAVPWARPLLLATKKVRRLFCTVAVGILRAALHFRQARLRNAVMRGVFSQFYIRHPQYSLWAGNYLFCSMLIIPVLYNTKVTSCVLPPYTGGAKKQVSCHQASK